MARMKSRLKSALANSTKKAFYLAKMKTLYTQRASRLEFEIGGARYNAADCGGVTFDPDAASGLNAIIFQRPNADLVGAGKEQTRVTCIADLGHKATATLDLTADIVLTSVAMGSARNTNTFTLQILAAAANPLATVIAAFTGTAAAIVLTITPNDGTNNGAVPVGLTTAQIAELINTGLVSGKTITLTDASSRRVLQTATGGGATAVADTGEGDGVVATFTLGVNSNTNSKAIVAYTGSDAVKHSFYSNVNSEGVDPAVAAATPHAVAYAAGATAAQIATAYAAAIDAVSGFDATASGSSFSMNNTVAGYATDVAAAAGADPGFTITKLGEMESYNLSDIVGIKRLRNKKWLIILNDASNAAHA